MYELGTVNAGQPHLAGRVRPDEYRYLVGPIQPGAKLRGHPPRR
ncbi:MAG: hypothetical protein WKG07_16360 [Hymenobacter sp.]